MTKDRWSQIQDLYEAALDHEPDLRSAFLRRACASDAELYQEVESLLGVEVHSLLVGRALDAIDLPVSLSPEGEQIGPYAVVRRLGTGGMGAVYLAERADGEFDQTVALKLVKRGMDTEAVLGRFRAERQILARLEHPNVARLLDGGLHADGRPFFAMEYVAGQPITAYADAHAMTVAERIAMFEDVCEAVAYAHQNLVVHRDLKPSNILVAPLETPSTASGAASDEATATGARGPRVKLLDFGIAKLLEGDDEGLTQTGQRVLTPAYAAPEQLRGEPVSTATDVYGLGVVLYELLSGHRPFEAHGREALEIAVLTETPERPSAAARRPPASGEDAAPDDIARQRQTTPERLQRRLRGDLDTIVLKAIHKEPGRRYASAESLLADLRAIRERRPISARPDSASYRLKKYVERHRVGVLSASGAALVLATLVTFYTLRLGAERDRARTEATKAEEVSGFLEDLFTSSDPAESRGAEITARELLAAGAARIETELAGQPEVQAQMFGTIGRVYRSLGLQADASGALERALALHSEPLAVARARTALAELRVEQGDFESADSLLALALATQRATYREPHPDLAATLSTQGVLLQERGDYEASEAPLAEALAMQSALQPGDHETTAHLLAGLGQTYFDLGRYEDAEQSYARGLAMRRRLHGSLHPDVTESLRLFSSLRRRQKRYPAAERLIREAIALDSQLVGLEHPNIGEDFYEYASVLDEIGRFDDATRVFERTLSVDLATLGPDHPYVALTLNNLGEARSRAGDRPAAITYYRRALDLQRRVLPPEHPEIALTLAKLGQALTTSGDPAGGERAIREGLRIRRASLDDDHPAVLSDRGGLASLLSQTGRHEEAIAIHRDILARRIRVRGAESPEAARSLYNLAAALRASGTPEALAEARSVSADALKRYRAIFAPDSREIGYALMERADVLMASGETAAARPFYRDALRAFRASVGPDHPATQRVARRLEETGQR